MIILLLLDLFFYNYTSFASCFFLLTFFKPQQSLLTILFFGFIWDFYFLHTNGLFILLLLILNTFRKKIKGITKTINLFLAYLGLATIFLFYNYLLFSNFKIFFLGIILNWFILTIYHLIFNKVEKNIIINSRK